MPCMHALHAPLAHGHIQGCSQDIPWVEGKLQEVAGIIPDLSGKIDRMKANIIIQLVTDTQVSLHASYICTVL